MGITGLIRNMIENWLKDRKQRVLLGINSKWIKVPSVVSTPVVGATSFLIFNLY